MRRKMFVFRLYSMHMHDYVLSSFSVAWSGADRGAHVCKHTIQFLLNSVFMRYKMRCRRLIVVVVGRTIYSRDVDDAGDSVQCGMNAHNIVNICVFGFVVVAVVWH